MRTKRNVSCFIIRSRIVPPYHHGCTIIDANEEYFELVSIGLYYVYANAFIYVYSIYLNIKINATEQSTSYNHPSAALSHLSHCMFRIVLYMYTNSLSCRQLRFVSSRKRNCRRFLSIYNFSSIIL